MVCLFDQQLVMKMKMLQNRIKFHICYWNQNKQKIMKNIYTKEMICFIQFSHLNAFILTKQFMLQYFVSFSCTSVLEQTSQNVSKKYLFHQVDHKKTANMENVVTKREYLVASIANVVPIEEQTLSIQHFAGNKTSETELKSSCQIFLYRARI